MDDLAPIKAPAKRRYGFAVMLDSSTPRPEHLQPLLRRAIGTQFTEDQFDVILVESKDLPE